MTDQVPSPMAVDVEPPGHALPGHRLLPRPGAHGPALPADAAGMRRKPDKLMLLAIGVAHAGITAWTWRDIRQRPTEQIRGSKRLWRVLSALSTGNSAAYWLAGRRYGGPPGGKADGQRLVRPGARPHPSKRLPGSHLGDVLLPRLQPASVQGLAEAPATGTFADVARARHQLVVTFRRDGSPVATTVWAAPAEGRLYIRTERASGKVKRLRRNPWALIAPSTVRGRPLGPPMPVTGRVLAADDEARAEQALASSHGWYRALFENSADQLRVDMCYLELTPQPQVADVPPAAGTEA